MKKLLIAVVLVSVLAGCDRYEEGPGISFKSRKERASNSWTLEKMEKLTAPTATTVYDNYTWRHEDWELTKDGVINYERLDTTGVITSYTGTWKLTDSDGTIKGTLVTPDTLVADIVVDWEILRLKEDELWVRDRKTLNKKYFKPL